MHELAPKLHKSATRSSHSQRWFLGADVGGTSTRVGISDGTGRIIAVATGGPGNPNAVGLEGSAAQIHAVAEDAVTQALAGDPGGTIVQSVIGLAGGTKTLASKGSLGFITQAVPEAASKSIELVLDIAVAFSAGTPARDGFCVLAGTGSGAAHIVDAQLDQRRDLWGWLLGDEGSGFWLGREAVRATLTQLERDNRSLSLSKGLSPLARAVLSEIGASDLNEVLRYAYADRPIRLAELSRLVAEAADHDPVAADIVRRGAVLLVDSVQSMSPAADEPIVVSGSVLTNPGPIGDAFAAELAGRLPNPRRTAGPGIVGALWIALRRGGIEDPSVHEMLGVTAS